MDFSGREQEQGKKFTGLAVVVGLHILLLWALVTGTANDLIKAVVTPMEAVIEKEKPKPPPPPDEPPPPPPKLQTPPPPFIPPPEVQVQQAPVNAPTITSSQVKPDSNVLPKTVTPAPVEAPKAPAGPSYVAAVIDFTKESCKPEYPKNSARNEETGVTTASVVTGADGSITSVTIVKSSGFRNLDKALQTKLMSGECRNKPGTIDGKAQPTTTTVEYTWKLD